MNVLVTGFGPFPGVSDNPTARLVRALDGLQIGRATVIGRVLPVSYRRGPEQAVRLARDHRAVLVVGTGVAASRHAYPTFVRRKTIIVDRSGSPDVFWKPIDDDLFALGHAVSALALGSIGKVFTLLGLLRKRAASILGLSRPS